MKITVAVETPVRRSFRVEQVAGLFDVQLADKTRFEATVEVPGLGDIPPDNRPTTARQPPDFADWKVGAIVGPSGSGKGQVARAAFGDAFLEACPGRNTLFTWPADQSILDAFPREMSMQDITAALCAVGFSSPPAWVLPYAALSTGQRMRCDLARALLLDTPLVGFDEFTSTVDRQVGQLASAAVAKSIRQQRFKVQRFVAVTCHYDVLAWLEPDWVLDMATRTLARGSLRRPEIRLVVHRLPPGGHGLAVWPLFERHHYLSATLHRAARCYVGLINDEPVSFCATIPNAGHRGKRIVHRLVVLPDYQGLGLGPRLLNTVAASEAADGAHISIRTSHPALIAAFDRRPEWRLRGIVRGGTYQAGFAKKHGRLVGSPGRATASFVFRGSKNP